MGSYTLADKSTHGFLLASDGNFTSIDFPGAAYTLANGIGPRGDIVGEVCHDGKRKRLAPWLSQDQRWQFDELRLPERRHQRRDRNQLRGDIVGYYQVGDNLNHGFLWSGGIFTSIAFPGALQGSLSGINPQGDITGTYRSADNVVHGFLLSDGDFTSLDFPDATYTNTTGIDARGDIVGRYMDAANVSHGYLLRDGQMTIIDFLGATFTALTAMNKSGDIVGRYSSPDGVLHGFQLAGFQPPCSTPGVAH